MKVLISLQGYGFLSENATFVDICKDHGIEFIGPTSSHINTMGDKSTARDTMKVCGSGCYLCIVMFDFLILLLTIAMWAFGAYSPFIYQVWG